MKTEIREKKTNVRAFWGDGWRRGEVGDFIITLRVEKRERQTNSSHTDEDHALQKTGETCLEDSGKF